VNAIGVLALLAGLWLALTPKGHPAVEEDPTMRGLGWVLAAVSLLLVLTGTLAPPVTWYDQAPAPPTAASPNYPVGERLVMPGHVAMPGDQARPGETRFGGRRRFPRSPD